MPTEWEPLGTPPPHRLTDTRAQLHWAAQVLAGVATVHNDPAPDDSHTSLTWDSRAQALLTAPGGGGRRLRAGLRLSDLSLEVREAAGGIAATLPLAGHTLADAYAWMEDAVGGEERLPRRTEEMPDHPVRSGAAFAADSAALVELARWYGNAALVLEEVRRRHAGASAVRTWPHHFDIATLITLDADTEPERARSVGVGMTPGDSSYDEPYFYVRPWPTPAPPELPALDGGGRWHREGWLGAVLTGQALVAGAPVADQRARVRKFLSSAVRGSRTLLGDSD